jgi:hypothetical protein
MLNLYTQRPLSISLTYAARSRNWYGPAFTSFPKTTKKSAHELTVLLKIASQDSSLTASDSTLLVFRTPIPYVFLNEAHCFVCAFLVGFAWILTYYAQRFSIGTTPERNFQASSVLSIWSEYRSDVREVHLLIVHNAHDVSYTSQSLVTFVTFLISPTLNSIRPVGDVCNFPLPPFSRLLSKT